MRLGEDELRAITLYAALCARRVLPIFEAASPDDLRPREAIAEAEAFAAGKRRTRALRATAWAAYAAGREVKAAAAANAAWAASHAAAAAYLHPIVTPHQIKHILGAAVHQALALEIEAGDDADIAGQQLRWAASLAPPSVRDVVARLPAVGQGRSRFTELLRSLDGQLRA
ncbi:putative immunity protein [Phenylobacterium sp.]|uniref:putative immunity protein n=1 Tax=Phenylobacterium sp. TaxID=1871053 RepID=UPI00286CBB74|nr:hypothetical protein [Phenylobacterium sp.]